jgi:diguanylate cyclase (GGDEF)-like protein
LKTNKNLLFIGTILAFNFKIKLKYSVERLRMVTGLQSSSRATLAEDKHITPFSDLMPKPDIKPELLLKLSSRLQTTLEIEQLLDIFFNEIKHAVLVDGMSYSYSNQNILNNYGEKRIHTCTYRLTTQKDCIGVLTFNRSTRFREHELANIEGLISTLVYPLRNAVRYTEALAAAFRDPLTGAGNRNALDKTLDREVELAKRHNQPLSVLMLDIDDFKSVNDSFGHAMGDEVLKQVVKSITACIRQTDMCFRYGGEEFLIMLTSADNAGAYRTAERIRCSIEEAIFTHKKGILNITSSIGSATLFASDTMLTIRERADNALYKAKNSGRNQVITDREKL